MRWWIALSLGTVLLANGCVVYEAPRPQRVYAPVPPATQPPPPDVPSDATIVGIDIEPPMAPPQPIAVAWSPPPMLVELPPPEPFYGAVWIGGYWVWDGDWVWAHGRWVAPPQPNYVWVHPYYEHRADVVVFVTGHWGPPGYVFVPPPRNVTITVVSGRRGVVPGPRPIGPEGVFVPPPPGSRRGLIVPAPMGTAPAVVTGAPPIVNVGMRVQASPDTGASLGARGARTTQMSVVAPASATANGQPVSAVVPSQAHVAAAMPAMVPTQAPPRRGPPRPAYAPERGAAPMPAAGAQGPRPAVTAATPAAPTAMPPPPAPAAATAPPGARGNPRSPDAGQRPPGRAPADGQGAPRPADAATGRPPQKAAPADRRNTPEGHGERKAEHPKENRKEPRDPPQPKRNDN